MGKNTTKDFADIYEKTYYNLRRFVQGRSNNPVIVDDILQEVYIEVYKHIDDLRNHRNSIGWIYKTADNKIKKLNYIYNKHVLNEINLDVGRSLIVEEDAGFIELEAYKEILEEDEYRLLLKKYGEGCSHKDLACMTGKSVAGSKMKLSRIRNKLIRNLVFTIVVIIGCKVKQMLPFMEL